MTNPLCPKPHGIARIWKGQTSRENADDYTLYMHAEGVTKLQSRGARAVQFLRADRSEFMVISLWETCEAMTRWAGTDPAKIRHLERDPELLLILPDAVQILDVYSDSVFPSDALP